MKEMHDISTNKIFNSIDNKHIFKYKKDIQDSAKYICHCCQNLCFALKICYTSKSYIIFFLENMKHINFKICVQMC
jgi:hypothetical protein